MTITSSLGAAVSGRPKELLGTLFAAVGAGHFTLWTQGPGAAFADALSAGDTGGAVGLLSSYTGAHPAYVLAVLAGIALVVWAWRQ